MRYYLFKIIVVGSPGIGKTNFVKNIKDNSHYYNDRYYIGVDFEIVNLCVADRQCKFQLWDLKCNQRFLSLHNFFYRGAKCCVLCFDLSNRSSFEDLYYWIKFVRNYEYLIPICLVGLKSDLSNQVSKEQIYDFAENFNVNGVFISSRKMPQRDKVLDHVAKVIIGEYQTPSNRELLDNIKTLREIECSPDSYDRNYGEEMIELILTPLREALITEIEKKQRFNNLTDEEKELFRNFLMSFSRCPICNKQNHSKNLESLFFSRETYKIELKKKLIALMKEINRSLYYNKISIGIPCCECFNKIFN